MAKRAASKKKAATSSTARKKKTAPRARQPARMGDKGLRVYEMEVALLSGPISREYMKTNRRGVVSRTIEIRSDQTLEDLHEAIFEAFDRFDPHLWEFQIGGKRPMDPDARRYVTDYIMEEGDGTTPDGAASETTIDSLRLKRDQAFGYWFDFGDDWWHQVTVTEIRPSADGGKYPRVTGRVGESPPQYPEMPDEEEEEDEDES